MLRGNHWRDWKTGGYKAVVSVDCGECNYPGYGLEVRETATISAPAVVDDFGNLVIVGSWL